MDQQPDIQEYFFSDILGSSKVDEEYEQSKKEWENYKFFKH
tara:strand:+ start:1274 stop:1396 length:123 start_codon:yes stop_codon:yes gene_type:complete